MDNIELFKNIIDYGEKKKHLQIITYKYKDKSVEITYENNKIKSAIIYTNDMKNHGWLSKEECEQMTRFLNTNEIMY